MTIFDLIFLFGMLGSVATLALAGIRVLRRRPAGPLCRRLLFVWLAYVAVLLSVSLLSSQRVVAAGTPQCSDDWCITLLDVTPTVTPAGLEYVAHLDLTNRGRGRPQREKYVSVYLVRADGSRVAPLADARDVPFDTAVEVGQPIHVSRRFRLPVNESPAAMVVTREGFGRFPGCCIIANDNSFWHKPTLLLAVSPRGDRGSTQ